MRSSRDQLPRGPGPVATAYAVSVRPCSWKPRPVCAVLPASNFDAATIASCWSPGYGHSQLVTHSQRRLPPGRGDTDVRHGGGNSALKATAGLGVIQLPAFEVPEDD